MAQALEQELNAALGIGTKIARTMERRGYRNGSKGRTLWLPTGRAEHFRVPRGQYFAGEQKEFQSTVLPRYQRQAWRVTELVMEFYLGGLATRQFNRALRPLFQGTGFSRTTVSKICQEMGGAFKDWRQQELQELHVPKEQRGVNHAHQRR